MFVLPNLNESLPFPTQLRDVSFLEERLNAISFRLEFDENTTEAQDVTLASRDVFFFFKFYSIGAFFSP